MFSIVQRSAANINIHIYIMLKNKENCSTVFYRTQSIGLKELGTLYCVCVYDISMPKYFIYLHNMHIVQTLYIRYISPP